MSCARGMDHCFSICFLLSKCEQEADQGGLKEVVADVVFEVPCVHLLQLTAWCKSHCWDHPRADPHWVTGQSLSLGWKERLKVLSIVSLAKRGFKQGRIRLPVRISERGSEIVIHSGCSSSDCKTQGGQLWLKIRKNFSDDINFLGKLEISKERLGKTVRPLSAHPGTVCSDQLCSPANGLQLSLLGLEQGALWANFNLETSRYGQKAAQANLYARWPLKVLGFFCLQRQSANIWVSLHIYIRCEHLWGGDKKMQIWVTLLPGLLDLT